MTWLGIICRDVFVTLPVVHDHRTRLGWRLQEQLWPVGPSEAVPSVAGPSGASGGAAPAGASAGGALAPGPAASAPAAAAAPLANYPPARATHEEVLADRELFNATWREALAALGINLDKVSWAAFLLQGTEPVGCLVSPFSRLNNPRTRCLHLAAATSRCRMFMLMAVRRFVREKAAVCFEAYSQCLLACCIQLCPSTLSPLCSAPKTASQRLAQCRETGAMSHGGCCGGRCRAWEAKSWTCTSCTAASPRLAAAQK